MIERKKELETLTVIELREIAKKLAVKRPMEKSREALICAIINRRGESAAEKPAVTKHERSCGKKKNG